jgi:oligopeptide/dipeptide ABC transporter ATP-binding protein
MSLLEVEDLHTYFDTKAGTVRAVEGVSLEIGEGEIVGLVGESGSGKSVTARSILDLIESPGRIVEGNIRFDGEDIRTHSQSELQRIRGERMSMVFQDPTAAFNPTQTVGRQLHDVLRTHRDGAVNPLIRILGLDHREAYRDRVVELLAEVGISEPESRYDDYPHEFSGGMLQRAMIAMSMLCEPDLVIADEPTTALDVTIERQILGLVKRLVRERGTSVLWITHDLSVVANLCDRIVVMYAGKVMEEGPTDEVLTDPNHPYTEGLLSSVPRYDRPDEALHVIEGDVPDPLDRPQECRFADRCPKVHDRCYEAHPPMYAEGDHEAACYLLESDPETEVNPR